MTNYSYTYSNITSGEVSKYVGDELLGLVDEENPVCLKLWEPDRVMVILGRSSVTEKEIFTDRCTADRIPILRRHGGGCSIVLLKGVMVISLASVIRNILIPSEIFGWMNAIIIRALQDFNVNSLCQKGVSDICINDKKIMGSSLYLSRQKMLYQSSLLVDCELSLIEKYLRHPVREPDYRHGRPHTEFLTTLWQQGHKILIDQLRENIMNIANSNISFGRLKIYDNSEG